jgi:UDP-glucose 4-epimerase
VSSTRPRRDCGDGKCQEALAELEAYLDGELPDTSSTDIADHLTACYPCTDRASFEEQLRAIVRRDCVDERRPSLVGSGVRSATARRGRDRRSVAAARRGRPGRRPRSRPGPAMSDRPGARHRRRRVHRFEPRRSAARGRAPRRRCRRPVDRALTNLAEAATVIAGRFEFDRLDIRQGGLAAGRAPSRPEVIFHLAAQVDVRAASRIRCSTRSVNVLGTVAVLEAARHGGVRKVVYASSVGSYGEPDEASSRSTSPSRRRRCRPTARASGSRSTTCGPTRSCTGSSGPRSPSPTSTGRTRRPPGEGGVVATFIGPHAAGQPCTIYGDGEQTRDFVFVDDVVHALVLAADRGRGERFMIGTGQRTSVNQLFRALAAATGYEHEPIVGARPGRGGPAQQRRQPRRAGRELGWKPWTTLEEGLAATLRWAAGRALIACDDGRAVRGPLRVRRSRMTLRVRVTATASGARGAAGEVGVSYTREVGERLRRSASTAGCRCRTSSASEGRWKAAVVGSYERGDRNISATRLLELAEFYEVHARRHPAGRGRRPAGSTAATALVLDLERLEQLGERWAPVRRYCESIQLQRGDFNRRVLSVRGEDLRALAVIHESTPEELVDELASSAS